MGKRSAFPREPRDFYPTPAAAVPPLLRHLRRRAAFIEPCCGDGALVRHLEPAGLRCSWASDIAPQGAFASTTPPQGVGAARCALTLTDAELPADVIVTNPPWRWAVLEPLLDHLSSLRPTWALLDADLAHTVQARALMRRCRRIASVGRLKWVEGSAHQGKHNAAWFLFGAAPARVTAFSPRLPSAARRPAGGRS